MSLKTGTALMILFLLGNPALAYQVEHNFHYPQENNKTNEDLFHLYFFNSDIERFLDYVQHNLMPRALDLNVKKEDDDPLPESLRNEVLSALQKARHQLRVSSEKVPFAVAMDIGLIQPECASLAPDNECQSIQILDQYWRDNMELQERLRFAIEDLEGLL